METTLGGEILAGAIFDRDYRSLEECADIQTQCASFCQIVAVHSRKEIENFLLVPEAMDRALQQRLGDRARRGGSRITFAPLALDVLEKFSKSKKAYVAGQLSSEARRYSRASTPQRHETEVMEQAYAALEATWATFDGRMSAVPGKDALGDFNRRAQEAYGVSVTPTAVISAMLAEEVPEDIRKLVHKINAFSISKARFTRAVR
jgi:hypothetical protein